MSDNRISSAPSINTPQFLELLAEWSNAAGGTHQARRLTKVIDHVDDALKAHGDKRYQEGFSVMRGQLAETAIKCFEAGEVFALHKEAAGEGAQKSMPVAPNLFAVLRQAVMTLQADSTTCESHQQGFIAGVHAAAALLSRDHGCSMFLKAETTCERQSLSPLSLVGAVNIILERYDELRGSRAPAAEFEILRAALAAHQDPQPKITLPHAHNASIEAVAENRRD